MLRRNSPNLWFTHFAGHNALAWRTHDEFGRLTYDTDIWGTPGYLWSEDYRRQIRNEMETTRFKGRESLMTRHPRNFGARSVRRPDNFRLAASATQMHHNVAEYRMFLQHTPNSGALWNARHELMDRQHMQGDISQASMVKQRMIDASNRPSDAAHQGQTRQFDKFRQTARINFNNPHPKDFKVHGSAIIQPWPLFLGAVGMLGQNVELDQKYWKVKYPFASPMQGEIIHPHDFTPSILKPAAAGEKQKAEWCKVTSHTNRWSQGPQLAGAGRNVIVSRAAGSGSQGIAFIKLPWIMAYFYGAFLFIAQYMLYGPYGGANTALLLQPGDGARHIYKGSMPKPPEQEQKNHTIAHDSRWLRLCAWFAMPHPYRDENGHTDREPLLNKQNHGGFCMLHPQKAREFGRGEVAGWAYGHSSFEPSWHCPLGSAHKVGAVPQVSRGMVEGDRQFDNQGAHNNFGFWNRPGVPSFHWWHSKTKEVPVEEQRQWGSKSFSPGMHYSGAGSVFEESGEQSWWWKNLNQFFYVPNLYVLPEQLALGWIFTFMGGQTMIFNPLGHSRHIGHDKNEVMGAHTGLLNRADENRELAHFGHWDRGRMSAEQLAELGPEVRALYGSSKFANERGSKGGRGVVELQNWSPWLSEDPKFLLGWDCPEEFGGFRHDGVQGGSDGGGRGSGYSTWVSPGMPQNPLHVKNPSPLVPSIKEIPTWKQASESI